MANDSTVTKAKTDSRDAGSFWGSIGLTLRKALVAVIVRPWKTTVLCREELAKTPFSANTVNRAT